MATGNKVITGGSLIVIRGLGPVFTLSARRFAIRGGADPGNVSAEVGSPYQAGASVSIDSHFAGELSLGFGPAAIRGTVYPRLYYSGSLTFTGEQVTVPDEDSAAIAKNRPFSLTGSLNGYTQNPLIGNPGNPVFSFLVSGEGMAALQLSSYVPAPGQQLHDFVSLVYTFDA